VIGALRPDGTVCTATLRLLLAVARGRSLAVTFHRAIDHVPDQMAALDAIAECGGVDYVLTSGGAATARAGADSISRMVAKCSRRNPGWTLASTPRIVAASGVGVADSPALVAATGVQDVHMGSAVATEVARGPVHAVAMGRGSAGKEHLRRVVDPAKVRAAVEMLGGQWKRARTA
jgi:copper homeostasis protein